MKLKALPNLLSGFRICLVPVFVFAYFADDGEVKVWAVSIYIVAAVTDFLDGFIARRLSSTSNLGKVLDPLGDKLMTAAALSCITIDGLIPAWAIAAVVVKELLMGIGGLVLHSKAKAEIPPSNIFGKTATVVFVAACAALMVFPSIPRQYASAMIGIAVGLTSAALISYILTFSAEMRKRRTDGNGGPPPI
ncbi:MAG: CDP-alcohol phosphatidyltransferase family protein [Oscillospiraceae bacterium]|jgi:CDP-diacylglycerol--glycerol-3-phosphate 3-phosphatidyltransferase|nr:CDP-alcohol phosphatidyltransferase family protein [Oscillospiraceae bacterium]